MVLRGRPRGRVGHRRTFLQRKPTLRGRLSLFLGMFRTVKGFKSKAEDQRLQVKGGDLDAGPLGPEPNFSRLSFGRPRGNLPVGPPLLHQSREPCPTAYFCPMALFPTSVFGGFGGWANDLGRIFPG